MRIFLRLLNFIINLTEVGIERRPISFYWALIGSKNEERRNGKMTFRKVYYHSTQVPVFFKKAKSFPILTGIHVPIVPLVWYKEDVYEGLLEEFPEEIQLIKIVGQFKGDARCKKCSLLRFHDSTHHHVGHNEPVFILHCAARLAGQIPGF
jgi:hypothetical protein